MKFIEYQVNINNQDFSNNYLNKIFLNNFLHFHIF